MRTGRIILTSSLLVALVAGGCSTVKSISDALTSLQRLQFKLGDVNNFSVTGIPLSNLSGPGDLSVMQVAGLVNAVQQKQLPVSFTLNVLAKNPNDGSNARPATPVYLRKIAWTLSIDDRTTINGVTDQNLMIPATGQTAAIPITMSLDLYKFFADRGYDDLLNLAFALGGRSGSSSRLKLTARVTAQVGSLAMEYPGDITIINSQFSNP